MIQKPAASVDQRPGGRDANSIHPLAYMSAEPEEPTVSTAAVPIKGEDVISTLPASMTPSGLKMKKEELYSIDIHIHRFAAWAASRAVMSGMRKKGMRFDVPTGTSLLEKSGVTGLVIGQKALPDPKRFDKVHREWRKIIIDEAKILDFSDGLAAKLINCYLKAALIYPHTAQNPKIKAIHPPVDRILLENLINDSKLKFGVNRGIGKKVPAWSKLGSDDYENIMEAIKEVLEYDVKSPRKGLWEIEKWWKIE
jgi:hypothetical protein